MDAHNKSTMANVVGWLALIVSIIALVLAWMAFDNTSEENLNEKIQNQMQDTVQIEQPQQDTMNNGNLNDMGNDGTTMPGSDENVEGDANTGTDTTIQEDDVIMPENTNQ